MRKFLVQIWAYNYHAKFEVLAKDNADSIEEAVLDKLGQKGVKWEYLGEKSMDHRCKRITYEEVVDGTRPVQRKTVLGTEVAVGV